MANLTRLQRGLADYDAELARHEAHVRARFEQLERALTRLSGAYEGTGAQAFKDHWQRTEAGVRDYLDGTRRIRSVLEKRLDQLKRADATDGL